ncbi:MAG: D-alanine--D-alanine ligase [Bacillota bacterium]
MAKVGLVYNLARIEQPEEGEPPDANAEYDSESTVLSVAEALRRGGHDVVFIEGDVSCYDRFLHSRLDIVFNMAEGIRGESRESHVPAILEMLGIPYTGSGVLTMAVCLNKATTKKILAYHGIPTARFTLLRPGAPLDIGDLRFPLFAKPLHEGSSMGISPESVIMNYDDLRRQVDYLGNAYRQDVIVEEYLTGREFTVAILGNDEPQAFPPMEIIFQHCPDDHGAVYSRRFKVEWSAEKYYCCPAQVDGELDYAIRKTALDAYRALDCREVARVDIRLDRDGVPNVMEINPLPGLAPGFSDLPRILEADGVGYDQLVNGIVDMALCRYSLDQLRVPLAARSIA